MSAAYTDTAEARRLYDVALAALRQQHRLISTAPNEEVGLLENGLTPLFAEVYRIGEEIFEHAADPAWLPLQLHVFRTSVCDEYWLTPLPELVLAERAARIIVEQAKRLVG